VLAPTTTDQVLAHLGLTGRPAPDAGGLRTVHRAYVSRVAYTGLTAQLGEHAPLDAEALVGRLLRSGRGGYCFEINTVLLALLEALGFVVERREAIVKPRGAREQGAAADHLALVVTVGEQRFVADAGWGEGWLDPLPLREGAHTVGPFTWVLEREDDGSWWVHQHAWGATDGFWFADTPSPLAAFAPHHERLATAPESSFVKTLVVQQPHADHVVTLRARTLAVDGPGRRERTILADEAALARTLRERFGIDPAALGADRLARLWAQACAQHEEHRAAQA
jgi:N-hydroxyarylamine O-acetyltransferase